MKKNIDPALVPQARIHVDLDALAANVRALKQRCRKGVRLMAVVKANAYGHGAVETAKTALAAGASFLAVARISEAVELRERAIEAPVLLFGDILREQARYAAMNNIRITLTSLDSARQISGAVKDLGTPARVHVKVDTGMGRLGLGPGPAGGPEGLADEIAFIGNLPGVKIEGLYTHLACADARDKTHAREQIRLFSRIRDSLVQRGIADLLIHAANSAAVIDLPEAHFDMVRPGIALYGLWPSPEVNRNHVDLKPVMSVTTRIIQLKKVPKGFGVSYGATHITEKPTRIATVPIGYADGYSRRLSSRGAMLVRGIRAPVLGRVCMDFTMIDVGHIPGVRVGDEVVVLGRQGSAEITADEIAGLLETINYEVVTGFRRRIPIAYKKE